MDVKFRVWCKDNNEWELDPIFLNSEGHALHMMRLGTLSHMKPESHIVQFWAGIFDKNGKRIFEGDIVRMYELRRQFEGQDEDEAATLLWIGVVSFSSGNFWFRADGRSENCWFHHNAENLEVIGNIFDNPELVPERLKPCSTA